MPSEARSFAFVKTGEFSHTNQHVLAQLQRQFPELRAEVIDVRDLPVIRRQDIPRLLAEVISDFGPAACLTNQTLRRHIGKTRHLFRRTRAVLLAHLSAGQYAFTFQTQSMFDASIPGTPHFIYTDHTHLENLKYAARTAATPFSALWAQVEREAYHNARMVFTMSDNIARSLTERYGCSRDRVECVYAGCNVPTAWQESIDNARYAARNILFVGVDWQRKGGPVLLEAFRRVQRAHPDATLTIVGCCPRIRMQGVHIAGRVPLEEVPKYYRSAAVFCLPTLNEPFGLVFLEAGAYGLPVVATNIGAIPEIVADGKSGYLVSPEDPDRLADRLIELLGDPVRCARFGTYARTWVAQRYSWDETGRRLATHITRATGQPSVSAHPAASPISGAPDTAEIPGPGTPVAAQRLAS